MSIIDWMDNLSSRMEAKSFRIRRGTAVGALYSAFRREESRRRVDRAILLLNQAASQR